MKVLILGNQFYDYQDEMVEKIKKIGHNVEFLSIDYKRNIFSKISHKLFGFYLYDNRLLNKIYLKIKNEKINNIIVIVGSTISKSFLNKVKNIGNVNIILYLWDDINRVINFKANNKYYDKCITFDREDSKNYNLEYVPLFHRGLKYKTDKKNIDLLFVGWLHSDRYEILKKIYEDNKDLNMYFKIFLNREQLAYKNIPEEWILKKPISSDKLFELMSASKAVVDINHPSQKGLTMRTIEALPYNLKIYTTNKEILNYDFYNNEMISIIDRKNPIIDRKILENSKEYEPSIVEQYSIDNWIDKVVINNLRGDK